MNKEKNLDPNASMATLNLSLSVSSFDAEDPRNSITNTNSRRRNKLIKIGVKVLIVLLIWAYFISATVYFINYTDDPFDETLCHGFGFLSILFIFVNFGLCYSLLLKPYCIPIIRTLIWKPTTKLLQKVPYGSKIFYVCAFAAILGYLIYDTDDDRTRLVPISGLCVYLIIGFLLCPKKKAIPWHTVMWGLILQFVFGLLTIRWSVGRNVFDCVGDKVNTFLSYAVRGSAFVYSDYLVNQLGDGSGVFAFRALATIYFLGFFINILYYYGIMQKVVTSLGLFLQFVMDTTICESVNSAANIFLGMSEAPLLLKPYLVHLTDSEIHSVMTSGFATVSGTVLAAYIQFGADPAHLITASVMSAPAALCFSKLMYPETEEIFTNEETIKDIKVEYDSVLDAASQGANDATKIVLGIIASLIAFLAFIYFINGVLSWLGLLVGYEELSIELILGKVFIPISYVMGVPWDECEKVGQLIGIKTMVNEFAAFEKMQGMELSPKSKMIATYSICGFSNPGSVGIMISALGGLIPTKREIVIKLVFRAFLGGAIVCFMTACIAATLIPINSL